MSMKLKDYRRQGQIFLTQAWEELERGDLRQASEKGWGAVDQLVKALALARNVELRRYRDMLVFFYGTVSEIGDFTMQQQFASAEKLSRNSLDDVMNHFTVNDALGQAQELVAKLNALLESENGRRGDGLEGA